ncbi:MAG TPA: sialate O-acetylesterase [Rhodanobacteraceae bacterium]
MAVVLWAAALSVHAADAPPSLLNTVFQDHMVLQRGKTIPVWGRAAPDTTVTVSIDGEKASARADAQGRWEVKLPPLHAGGPHVLTAADGATWQTVHDVLIGDVWLCAGQSNMALPISRTLNLPALIADAHDDSIRMLTVERRESVSLRSRLPAPVTWEKTSPRTVARFSATCYDFARALQKKIHVPLGLINASWGGSQIQAWMSPAALHKVGGHDKALAVLAQYAKDPVAANARWGKLWEAWWRALPSTAQGGAAQPWNPARPAGAGWHVAPRGLGGYGEWGVPELAHFVGMLWFRTTVTLTAGQAAQPAMLSLGTVDELDETWVNGRAVGSAYIGSARHYHLPRGLLHAGTNVIVVNDLNTYADGGIIGPASSRALHFADGTSVPLDGTWKYRMVPATTDAPPIAPWLSAYGLGTLYNSMIAPLGHYAIRGEIWYQGASNTSDPAPYAALLRAYRAQMRARFGKHLPFLIVQLAGYGPASTQPGPSHFAQLREAQREVASDDPHSALAVAIDIGSRYTIHPASKQELGRRLARAARHVAYGDKALPPSGPVPLSATRDGNAVVVRFGDVTKGLVAYGASQPIGFELCGAKADACHYATATIHGDDVILQAANAATATRVRYGWADDPVVTLYDRAPLPAGPFQISIRQAHRQGKTP